MRVHQTLQTNDATYMNDRNDVNHFIRTNHWWTFRTRFLHTSKEWNSIPDTRFELKVLCENRDLM